MDDLLEALEGASNFMRGLAMDPNIQGEPKLALVNKAAEIDKIVTKFAPEID